MYRNIYSFLGEEILLRYIVFDLLGETKLRMSQHYFGGDPRRFKYSIRLIGVHLYEAFYYKVSENSMMMWVDQIEDFRYDIWDKF